MNIDEYQIKAEGTNLYPEEAKNLCLFLGLLGEAAEVAEKLLPAIKRSDLKENSLSHSLTVMQLEEYVRAGKALERTKKLIRDKNALSDNDYNWVKEVQFTPDEEVGIMKEMGGNYWYLGTAADRIGYSSSDILQFNLQQLADRAKRGTLHGSGDNR